MESESFSTPDPVPNGAGSSASSEGGRMKELSRDDILGAEDIITELVEVKEWGGTVRVRGLTGRERDAFEASIVGSRAGKSRQQNLQNVRAKLCALSLVDASGQRMFTERDIQALGNKSAAALNQVWNTAQRLSGLSDEEVDELAEGFTDAPSELSTSG